MNLSEAKKILKEHNYIVESVNNSVFGIPAEKWKKLCETFDYYTGDCIQVRNNGRKYFLLGGGGGIKGPGDFGEITEIDEVNHKLKFNNHRYNKIYEYSYDPNPDWKGHGWIMQDKNELHDRSGKVYKIKNIKGLTNKHPLIFGNLEEFNENKIIFKTQYDHCLWMDDEKRIPETVEIEIEGDTINESWSMKAAANLLNEDFKPFGSDEQYSSEEIRKILKQREMLHEETDSDSSLDSIFETLTKTRDVWLKELQETLPEGYHATAYTGSCATGLSKRIPGINITHDVEKEPGKYILVNNQNPRKIEFEGVGPCTLNGWEEKVAIHYPGIRRIATRFTLPGMYNYKKAVANFIDNMINNK